VAAKAEDAEKWHLLWRVHKSPRQPKLRTGLLPSLRIGALTVPRITCFRVRPDRPDSEAIRNAVAAPVSPSGLPQTFVLLVNDDPVGTASLVSHDLDERPDLTPWLAGVFVVPEARGRGHVMPLIRAVEDACRSAGIGTVWLCTADEQRGSHPASRQRPGHAHAS
jgi:hypothetical protein